MAFFLTAQNDKNPKHAKKTSQQLGALKGTIATSDEFNVSFFDPRFGDTLR